MLRLRVLSALVGIPIILVAVRLGGLWYALFLLVVASLGVYEYTRMLKAAGFRLPVWPGYAGAGAMIVLVYLEQQALLFHLIMLILVVLFMAMLFNFEKINFWESAQFFWGIIYLGGLLGFMLLVRLLPQGELYTYALLAGVWLHDTLAYFIGIKWGRRRLAPRISPKKSVEGSLAGIIGTVGAALLIARFLPGWLPLAPWKAGLLAFGLAVFAQLGDLMESALKRQFQVKDTGQLIPGHGGIMDRFDSLMLAAPFVYLFVKLLG
jgi:phosphatidate cytidylyltransferase